MALNAESSGGVKPIYTFTGIVKDIALTYSHTAKSGNVFDIYTEIKVDIEKKDGETYEKTIRLFSNFKRDNSGRIVDWGSANKLRFFLNCFGSSKWSTDDDGAIPEAIIKRALGKEVTGLTYRTDKDSTTDVTKRLYSTWDNFRGDGDEEALIEQFIKSVAKGFPKDYDPKIEEKEDAPTPLSTGSETKDDIPW